MTSTDTMKLSEFTFKHIDLDEITSATEELCSRLRDADEGSIIEIFKEWCRHKTNIISTSNLIHILYTSDTSNEDIRKEKEWLDSIRPQLSILANETTKQFVSHAYWKEIENTYGHRITDILENQIRSFDPKAAKYTQEIANLTMQYSTLTSSAQFEFKGEKHNFSSLAKFASDPDRNIRHDSSQVIDNWVDGNHTTLHEIFDGLIKTRHKEAVDTGHQDYQGLAYQRYMRTSYGPDDVAAFRIQVIEHVVPLMKKIRKKQAELLQVDQLMVWDESVLDVRGNPTPLGDVDTILEETSKMYHELSPGTGAFFDMMRERELFDLLARKKKTDGGYCTFLPDYKAPFIFCNFNGTESDIKVMTHECGHAFQISQSMNVDIPEYITSSPEAAEIHSMSMQFLTWPWMKLFFGEEEGKRYCANDLISGLCRVVPLTCMIDEFEEIVYRNPGLSYEDRCAEWNRLQDLYLPDKNYGDIAMGARGAGWLNIMHIYQVPFYSISYSLAFICALQIWKRAGENREQALEDYFKLCEIGGSKSYMGILEAGNLDSPFKDGVVKENIDFAEKWIEKNWFVGLAASAEG